jgi:hypothetical protein
MERPTCEWNGIGGCSRKATQIVLFMDDYRGHLSCDEHLERWNKAGRGVYFGKLTSYQPPTTIEDIFQENQRRDEERSTVLENFHYNQQRRRELRERGITGIAADNLLYGRK